jgi:hypothetical protein
MKEHKITAELAPGTDTSLFAGFGLKKDMVTAVITITDTPERIQALEQTLTFGGYEYGITRTPDR